MQLKPGSPCVCVWSSLVAEGLWEFKQYKDTGFYDIRENNRQLPTRHFSNTRVPVVKRQALNQAQSLGKTKKVLQKQDCDLSGTDRDAAGTTDAQWCLLHEGETQEAPDKAALWCVRLRAPWFIERFETVQNKWGSVELWPIFFHIFNQIYWGNRFTCLWISGTSQHRHQTDQSARFRSRMSNSLYIKGHTHIPTLILSGQ